jgi:hypothetical protein
MHDHIVRQFADAGLTLAVAQRPIVSALGGAARQAIVQIDIQRGHARHEWFRLFPGADTNRVEVVGADRKIGQVVMLVHEPARAFTETVGFGFGEGRIDPSQPDWRERMASQVGGAVRAEDVQPAYSGKYVSGALVRRVTPDQKRHMLCGLDERQLFVAQLPKGVSTVREAHACLKAPKVREVEGRGGGAIRQGEWFFMEAHEGELHNIEYGLRRNHLVIERSVPIGPFTVPGGLRGMRRVRQFRGNPHTADELIVTGHMREGLREVFVRGRIRHVDHATVKLRGWHSVVRNTEATPVGIGWVD